MVLKYIYVRHIFYVCWTLRYHGNHNFLPNLLHEISPTILERLTSFYTYIIVYIHMCTGQQVCLYRKIVAMVTTCFLKKCNRVNYFNIFETI